jgi:hypothetical protein
MWPTRSSTSSRYSSTAPARFVRALSIVWPWLGHANLQALRGVPVLFAALRGGQSRRHLACSRDGRPLTGRVGQRPIPGLPSPGPGQASTPAPPDDGYDAPLQPEAPHQRAQRHCPIPRYEPPRNSEVSDSYSARQAAARWRSKSAFVCQVCFRGTGHSFHGSGSRSRRTQRNASLTCEYTEPPIGIEPMTYALRVRRSNRLS